MRKLIVASVLGLLVVSLPIQGAEPELPWAQWRGPLATGVSPDADPPTEWSEGQNIKWRAEIPGSGSSTPIVVGDLVIVQAAVSLGEEEAVESGADVAFHVIAYDRQTGERQWQQTVAERETVAGVRPGDGNYASHSPVSDGGHIWAYFGSYGIYCLDMEGEVVWSRQFEPMRKRGEFGEAASPALHEDRLVIVRDHEGDSSIVTLDATTGDVIWRESRDEISSWATPLVLEVNGRAQAIVPASGMCRGYDLETGEVIWQSLGLTTNVIPSPVYAGDLVYLMSGFRGEALQAIRIEEAEGDIDESSAIAWTHNERTPYVPSPVVYEGGLYFLRSNSGVLTVLDAESGEPWYTERLDLSQIYASPVAADGRVYFLGRHGKMLVLEHGESLEVIAENELDEAFDASPALAGDQLFLRGQRTLYCIEEE